MALPVRSRCFSSFKRGRQQVSHMGRTLGTGWPSGLFAARHSMFPCTRQTWTHPLPKFQDWKHAKATSIFQHPLARLHAKLAGKRRISEQARNGSASGVWPGSNAFKKTNLLMESVSNLLMQTLRMDILTQCFFNQRGRLAFGLRRHLLKSHHFSRRMTWRCMQPKVLVVRSYFSSNGFLPVLLSMGAVTAWRYGQSSGSISLDLNAEKTKNSLRRLVTTSKC